MGASDSEEGNEDNVEHSSLTKVFSLSLSRVFRLMKLLWSFPPFYSCPIISEKTGNRGLYLKCVV